MTNQNEITQAALVELIAIAADRTGIPPAAADAMAEWCASAEQVAWGDGEVLKLYHPWVRPEDIEYEAWVGRTMRASGLPAPRVGEIVQVGGRNGLLYERLYGPSMLEMLLRKPWRRFDYAQRLAALLADEFNAEHKIDLRANHRAWARLLQAAGAGGIEHVQRRAAVARHAAPE